MLALLFGIPPSSSEIHLLLHCLQIQSKTRLFAPNNSIHALLIRHNHIDFSVFKWYYIILCHVMLWTGLSPWSVVLTEWIMSDHVIATRRLTVPPSVHLLVSLDVRSVHPSWSRGWSCSRLIDSHQDRSTGEISVWRAGERGEQGAGRQEQLSDCPTGHTTWRHLTSAAAEDAVPTCGCWTSVCRSAPLVVWVLIPHQHSFFFFLLVHGPREHRLVQFRDNADYFLTARRSRSGVQSRM